MESLKELFHNLKLPPKLKENLKLYIRIRNHWNKILEGLTDKTYPLFIEKGVLFIGVSNNYLLQELNCRYLEILEKIKEILNQEEKNKIEGLKFVYHKTIKASPTKGAFKKAFSKEELKVLRETCKSLPDEELAQAFQRILRYL